MCHPAKPCTADCAGTYHVPDFVRLAGVPCRRYVAWLNCQAEACKRRDDITGRHLKDVYRAAIHKAVVRSAGLDDYTGEPLEWNRLNHERVRRPGRRSHRINGRYPSVDHYQGTNVLSYRICAGTVNFAKGALDHQQFVALCRKVAAYHTGWGKPEPMQPA